MAGSRPITMQQVIMRPVTIITLMVVLCSLLLLTACGPERRGTASREELAAETVRIAQEYEQNGDLSRARVQLQAMDAANPTQFLIYLVEERVATEPNAPETTALVRLALAMGLQSNPVMTYAIAHNLVAGSVAVNAATPVVAPQAGGAAVAQTGQAAGSPGVAEAGVAQAPAGSDAAGAETDELLPLATATPRPDSPAAPAAEPAASDAPAAETEATPTATTISKPMAQASNAMNVREGPGTAYPVVGAMDAGEQVEIIAKNPQADWWQVSLPSGAQGWVYGPLVQTAGDTSTVAVASNIPAPPPTPTPAPTQAPVVEAPPAQAPAAEQPPAEQAPAEQPAPPPSDKPHFSLVAKRLWSKAENGDCRGQHLLRIHVVDANGNRLNGVALQGIYTGEIFVTGAQGKGDGVIEFDLYGAGEGFRVIRDTDGREATSDNADGFTTRSIDIPEDVLIQAGYCSNHEDCQIFYSSYGCHGHHSWEATFQRNY